MGKWLHPTVKLKQHRWLVMKEILSGWQPGMNGMKTSSDHMPFYKDKEMKIQKKELANERKVEPAI